MLLPTIQIPELENKTDEEVKDCMTIYIMQFGNLNYGITLKALEKISKDEKLTKEFRQIPLPTLARESVKLTQFTEKEKEKYRLSQEIEYTHYPCEHILRAVNKGTGMNMPEYDRPLNQLEEDFYFESLLSYDEYQWCKYGRLEGKPQPSGMKYKFTEDKLGESEYAKTQKSKVRS